jgi:hypothetical protein
MKTGNLVQLLESLKAELVSEKKKVDTLNKRCTDLEKECKQYRDHPAHMNTGDLVRVTPRFADEPRFNSEYTGMLGVVLKSPKGTGACLGEYRRGSKRILVTVSSGEVKAVWLEDNELEKLHETG